MADKNLFEGKGPSHVTSGITLKGARLELNIPVGGGDVVVTKGGNELFRVTIGAMTAAGISVDVVRKGTPADSKVWFETHMRFFDGPDKQLGIWHFPERFASHDEAANTALCLDAWFEKTFEVYYETQFTNVKVVCVDGSDVLLVWCASKRYDFYRVPIGLLPEQNYVDGETLTMPIEMLRQYICRDAGLVSFATFYVAKKIQAATAFRFEDKVFLCFPEAHLFWDWQTPYTTPRARTFKNAPRCITLEPGSKRIVNLPHGVYVTPITDAIRSFLHSVYLKMKERADAAEAKKEKDSDGDVLMERDPTAEAFDKLKSASPVIDFETRMMILRYFTLAYPYYLESRHSTPSSDGNARMKAAFDGLRVDRASTGNLQLDSETRDLFLEYFSASYPLYQQSRK